MHTNALGSSAKSNSFGLERVGNAAVLTSYPVRAQPLVPDHTLRNKALSSEAHALAVTLGGDGVNSKRRYQGLRKERRGGAEPDVLTGADAAFEVLQQVRHGAEVRGVGHVQLRGLRGDLAQLLLHRLAHTHGVHDDAYGGYRGRPRPQESHLPACNPTPRQRVSRQAHLPPWRAQPTLRCHPGSGHR